MLREIPHVQQVRGELHRRWFTSDKMDLIVWCDRDNAHRPVAFQFCYDKGVAERALTWTPESGFSHMAVDDGERHDGVHHKSTPILKADGKFDAGMVADCLLENGGLLPPEIIEFVSTKIRTVPC